MNKKLKYGIPIAVVFIIIIIYSMSLKVVDYNLITNKVNGNIKIALVTDLHSCNYGENQYKLIDVIKSQEPDIVLLGGDIVDDVIPRKKSIEFLERVSSMYPCYYVSGNHEFWSNDIDGIKNIISGYGINILEGDTDILNINGNDINICGIDDPEVGESIFYEQLKNCNVQSNNGNYTVLLTHRPELIDKYNEYNFDLILSGHAHGGQWRIPFILNGLIAPNQGLFPKYAGGLYKFEDNNMIVSRGLARESTIIPRIFNRPELVIIDIDNK